MDSKTNSQHQKASVSPVRHRPWPYLYEEHLPAVFASIIPSRLELSSIRDQCEVWDVAEPSLGCVCQLHGGVKETLLALAQ